jgi:hypothetical protein
VMLSDPDVLCRALDRETVIDLVLAPHVPAVPRSTPNNGSKARAFKRSPE